MLNHGLSPEKIILITPRLILRELQENDLSALCQIMCDEDTMRAAYNTPFSPQEVFAWLQRHLKRYRELGFGLWAVVLKDTGQLIGQCGLTLQQWKDKEILEIGYLFQKAFWHKGYATEAAQACKGFAFSFLGTSSVYSIIGSSHTASRNVAQRNGMKIVDSDTKVFRGKLIEFYLYCVDKTNDLQI